MSLLNQMLRDLEQRRASSEERGVLPDQVRALPPPRTPATSGGVLPWAIVATAGVVAAALVWWWMRPAPENFYEHEPVAEQPAPTPVPGARLSYEIAHPPAPHAAAPARTHPLAAPAAAAMDPSVPATVIAAGATHARTQAAAPSSITVTSTTPAASGAAPPPPVPRAAAVPGDTRIAKDMHELTPAERAENEFRRGNTLMTQGQAEPARAAYEAALTIDAAHAGARQALLGMLIQAHDYPAAERVLNDGLAINPAQPGLALALAHLQVERGDSAAALTTLSGAENAAHGNADYLAFMAALYERGGDHAQAADHYQAALALRPQAGVWLMGLGMALQGQNRNAEAREAYQRAQASNSLTPELQAYVTQRLGQIP